VAAETAMTAAVTQARESQRIVRDRYEQGLAESVALLRAAELVFEAEASEASASAGVLTARAALDRATGSGR
jgi:outer membrane protein TolC